MEGYLPAQTSLFEFFKALMANDHKQQIYNKPNPHSPKKGYKKSITVLEQSRNQAETLTREVYYFISPFPP